MIRRETDPTVGSGRDKNLYPRELLDQIEECIVGAFRRGDPKSFLVDDGSQGRYRVTVEKVCHE